MSNQKWSWKNPREIDKEVYEYIKEEGQVSHDDIEDKFSLSSDEVQSIIRILRNNGVVKISGYNYVASE